MNREATVTRALTGHTHYMSPYECYDSCGTCDGARCETCRERWVAEGWDLDDPDIGTFKKFSTKEKAQEYADAWEKGEV